SRPADRTGDGADDRRGEQADEGPDGGRPTAHALSRSRIARALVCRRAMPAASCSAIDAGLLTALRARRGLLVRPKERGGRRGCPRLWRRRRQPPEAGRYLAYSLAARPWA